MPVVINGDTGITQAGEFNSDSSFGFKNRLINGGMVIDQRNNGASTTGSNTLVYVVDRWASFEDTDGTMTFQQSSVAPAGFSKSIVATTTVADSSLAATQRVILLQRIEGYNIADLGWGTANAAPVTLSFWVRSSLTGTFGGSLTDTARSYPFTYTISVADTWEYKTIPITGDTSGTWNSTNGWGVQVAFGLGCGSSFSGTSGAWTNGDLNSATGATSVIGTNGATFYVTGVQFEKGSTATSFDFRSYGQELLLCQRYYTQINGTAGNPAIGLGTQVNTTTIAGFIPLPVTLRSTPTVVSFLGGVSVTDTFAYNTGMTISSSVLVANGVSLAGTISANGAQGRPILFVLNGAGTNFGVSAEL
jgi:hypothetical protein